MDFNRAAPSGLLAEESIRHLLVIPIGQRDWIVFFFSEPRL